MAARVFMLHGAMIIPSCRNDPLAIDAPWSSRECTTDAVAASSRAESPVSFRRVTSAHRLRTRWVSTFISPSAASNRTPYTAPVAPVIATMMRIATVSRGSHAAIGPRRSKHIVPASALQWSHFTTIGWKFDRLRIVRMMAELSVARSRPRRIFRERHRHRRDQRPHEEGVLGRIDVGAQSVRLQFIGYGRADGSDRRLFESFA